MFDQNTEYMRLPPVAVNPMPAFLKEVRFAKTMASAGDAKTFWSLLAPDVLESFGFTDFHAARRRFVCETVYGARKVAQKFWPYTGFQLAKGTRASASERQMRLLGQHGISNYG